MTTDADVDRILDLLDHGKIERKVLLRHDEARERFSLPSMVVSSAREFKFFLEKYVQHHWEYTGQGRLSPERSFSEARRILDGIFSDDPYQEGYVAALQMGLDGTKGGMREILNQVATALKRRHLQDYSDHVFYEHIDPLSKADAVALGRAYYRRFGEILRRFGCEVPSDELSFASNPRAALEYHRQVLERILGIAKKI